jgi:Domain of unknown function (DUF1929)/PA14 domain
MDSRQWARQQQNLISGSSGRVTVKAMTATLGQAFQVTGIALLICLTACTAENGPQETPTTAPIVVETPEPDTGTGTGLRATYFKTDDLTGPQETQLESDVSLSPEIDPAPNLAGTGFSASWGGQLQAPEAGEWTLVTVSNGGVRLEIDGKRLIDRWTQNPNQTPNQSLNTQDSAQLRLEANRLYDLHLEFRGSITNANLKLLWTGPGRGRQRIPKTRLFPLDATRANLGEWGKLEAWPVLAIHGTVLPNGKLLTWGGGDKTRSGKDEPGAHDGNDADLWDPTNISHASVRNTSTELFCSGHALTPDGTLLVAGGNWDKDVGKIDTNLFDWNTNTWTRGANMNAGRWYPTVLPLANGELLTLEGKTETKAINRLPQIWKTAGGWRDLSNAIRDDTGRNDANQNAEARETGLYPWVFAAPNGKVVKLGPSNVIETLSTQADGAWSNTTSNRGDRYRNYGIAVQIAPDRVLIAGGTDETNPATRSSKLINLNTLGTSSSGDLQFGRTQFNATILPDGSVLASGGHGGNSYDDPARAARSAERWQNGIWTTLASEINPRMYHSIGLLLPDARVFSGGGGRCDCQRDYQDAQLFSPPYLFNHDGTPAVRPAPDVPDRIAFGQSFTVGLSDPSQIGQVSLVRLSSVTHSLNMNQRFVELNFVATASGLTIRAPSNGNTAPPGHYLLFVINSRGVPSVGKIVQLR